MNGYQNLVSLNPNINLNNLRFKSRKTTLLRLAILSVLVLGVVYSIALFIHSLLYTSFKSLITVNYNTNQAINLLNNPKTISYTTREGDLYLTDLQNFQLQVVPENNTSGTKMTNLKISKSRRYIVWQTEIGIVGLDIAHNNVFLIDKNIPRQAFDLSPVEDKLVYIKENNLIGVKLTDGHKDKSIVLPKLVNNTVNFNQTTYSPNGKYVFIRSIHKCCANGSEDALVDLNSNKIIFLPEEFSDSDSVSPIWSNDSLKLYHWKENKGLLVYDLSNNNLSTLLSASDIQFASEIDILPTNNMVVLNALVDLKQSTDPNRKYPKYTGIVSASLQDNQFNLLIRSDDKRLSTRNSGYFTSLGYLPNDTIWFIYNNQSRDLWTISSDGKSITKLIDNVGLISLRDISIPNYILQ